MRMKPVDLKKTLEELELSLILKAMRSTKNNKSQACKLLKIKRTTLMSKLRKYKMIGMQNHVN